MDFKRELIAKKNFDGYLEDGLLKKEEFRNKSKKKYITLPISTYYIKCYFCTSNLFRGMPD